MVTIANAIYDSVFEDELESWNATEMKLREQLQEKDSQLQEKDSQLQKQTSQLNAVLSASVKTFASQGIPPEEISKILNVPVEEVNIFLA